MARYPIWVIGSDLCTHTTDILSYSDYQKFVVPGVCVFDFVKYHNHRYEFLAFFFSDNSIIFRGPFRSKSNLYGAVQKLLQEKLNHVGQ